MVAANRAELVEVLARSLPKGEMIARRGVGLLLDFLITGVPTSLAFLAVRDDYFPPVLLLTITLVPLYYISFEGLLGRTPGKMVSGTVVVDAQGRQPGLGRATVRTLLRFIDANPGLFFTLPGVVAILASDKGQRLGDMAARTYVVRATDRLRSVDEEFS